MNFYTYNGQLINYKMIFTFRELYKCIFERKAHLKLCKVSFLFALFQTKTKTSLFLLAIRNLVQNSLMHVYGENGIATCYERLGKLEQLILDSSQD